MPATAFDVSPSPYLALGPGSNLCFRTPGFVPPSMTSSPTRPGGHVATHCQLFIGGQWSAGSAGRTFETIDPANGEVLGTAVEATADDVDAAVEAATRAFADPAWRGMTPS